MPLPFLDLPPVLLTPPPPVELVDASPSASAAVGAACRLDLLPAADLVCFGAALAAAAALAASRVAAA